MLCFAKLYNIIVLVIIIILKGLMPLKIGSDGT